MISENIIFVNVFVFIFLIRVFWMIIAYFVIILYEYRPRNWLKYWKLFKGRKVMFLIWLVYFVYIIWLLWFIHYYVSNMNMFGIEEANIFYVFKGIKYDMFIDIKDFDGILENYRDLLTLYIMPLNDNWDKVDLKSIPENLVITHKDGYIGYNKRKEAVAFEMGVGLVRDVKDNICQVLVILEKKKCMQDVLVKDRARILLYNQNWLTIGLLFDNCFYFAAEQEFKEVTVYLTLQNNQGIEFFDGVNWNHLKSIIEKRKAKSFYLIIDDLNLKVEKDVNLDVKTIRDYKKMYKIYNLRLKRHLFLSKIKTDTGFLMRGAFLNRINVPTDEIYNKELEKLYSSFKKTKKDVRLFIKQYGVIAKK